MQDPDFRMAILKEMASIRHELSRLHDPRHPPLGPVEFIQRYTQQLESRLASLEEELKDADRLEDSAD